MGWIDTLHAGDLGKAVEEAFRGPIAELGGAVREPQIAVAQEVARTIESGVPGRPAVLAAEAATGLGKGLSYLVPGVLAAIRNRVAGGGKPSKFVVSTANIALQRQLVTKDVPMLASALGLPITAAVLKGRSNYVCLDRLAAERQLLTDRSPFVTRVAEWVDAGGTGDREDLPWAAQGREWGAISVSGDECLGKACPLSEQCFANRAAKVADTATVLVVNHSLLALIPARLSRGALALFVDEAHEWEDAIRNAGAFALYESTAAHHAKILQGLDLHAEAGDVRTMAAEVFRAAFDTLGRERAMRLRPGWLKASGNDLADRARVLGDNIERAMETIASRMVEEGSEPHEVTRVERRADQAGRYVRRIALLADPQPRECAWVEQDDRRGCALHHAQVDATGPVQFPAVVMVSATLAVGGKTGHAARSLGYPSPAEIAVGSPWPIASMAVAIVPREAPDPSEAGWDEWADDAAVRYVRACGGGVLVLATSHRRAQGMAKALRAAQLPFGIRVQGEAGRSELADWMRNDIDGVLVGTRSLFQGLDIQGQALRGVLIDKIPFPSPADPMEQAIGDVITARGGNPFRERSLVVASNLLRQAAGRLLRSPNDRGSVCVLDRRILGKFRHPLLSALAPIPVSGELDDARRILSGEGLTATTPSDAIPRPKVGRPGASPAT